MKNFLIIVAVGTLLCSSSEAGWSWNKERLQSSKSYGVESRTTSPSSCYDTGFEFSGFMSGFWPEDGAWKNSVGGGAALAYFFNHNFGAEVSYSVHGSGDADHVATGNLVYRLPLGGECCSTIAPYFFGGIGLVHANSSERLWNLGAGVDVRFESWGCLGLFADWSYAFVDENIPDFSMVRAGFRIPF